MVIVALALIASLRDERQLDGYVTQNQTSYKSYMREIYMSGDVYFLCAQTLALGALMIVLLAYSFHTVSSMIVPKSSAVENWMNMLLALVVIVAGIVELCQTEAWKWSPQIGQYLFTDREHAQRLAAGIISLITGVFFLISFAVSYRELQGPKPV